MAPTTSAPSPRTFSFTIETEDYRALPIPGVNGKLAKLGDCFVRIIDLPEELDKYMEVNPRVPKRTQKGVLSGPVIKGILETIREKPEDMAIKNQGIYLLVDDAQFQREKQNRGVLTITFSDPKLHGIVNGGHTYAAIREAVEQADEPELSVMEKAFVRLHIIQGIQQEKVTEIAEGLNRSKQVDDPSLANLNKEFVLIKQAMKGKPGEEAIAYHQGGEGEVYITEVLVLMEMFNCERFNDNDHPHGFYRRSGLGLKAFESDLKLDPSPAKLLIPNVPDILALSDHIRKATPAAANKIGFQFGRMKPGGAKERAGAVKHKNTPLPFINDSVNYRVPNGWLYPMLAAFRANVEWDLKKGIFRWRMPLDELVPRVMPELVRVCVSEHRDNNTPEMVGKRESAYRQCYDKVQLELAKSGKLF